ncbi:UNVERIFIED_CONTAM: hypothetical protein GTU68_002289 [Idotea baltica]|nr:hypothetical protein [Idotea baltica]
MKTELSTEYLSTAEGKEANEILRTCVHCGFCNATCPTYQLLGDEKDGPRGRIYLIKQLLEGHEATTSTQLHLDRCLTCRNCETTCPSGVKYSNLLEIGRKHIEAKVPRDFKSRALRQLMLTILPYEKRFTPLMKMGQLFKPLVPKAIKKKIPPRTTKGFIPKENHDRRMLILSGCVQPSMSPDINAATARVLNKLEISAISEPTAGCCGAVSLHLAAEEDAHDFMRNNIDAWWPEIESGVEAIIMTASGCGSTVKEYGHALRHDKEYAAKAKRVSDLCKDISEVLAGEDLSSLTDLNSDKIKVSYHPPCTLQHGQKITGVVENILGNSGYELLPVMDSHLCCGSAGTYSVLQPEISQQLQSKKIDNLLANKPDMVVTSNIGCQTHLQEVSKVPVVHWIHLLDS